MEGNQIWYESKELLELEDITRNREDLEGLFELNLNNNYINESIPLPDSPSKHNGILVSKKFKPIHYSGGLASGKSLNEPKIYNSQTPEVSKDQLACAILKLQTKSDNLDLKLSILSEKIDQLAGELLSARKEKEQSVASCCDNQKDDQQLDQNKHQNKPMNIFWFTWPILLCFVMSRFGWPQIKSNFT